MTTQVQILTLVAAVLVAVERALSKGVIGPNLTLAAKTAALAGIALVLAALNSVVGGDTWQTAVAAAIATTGTAFVTALMQAVSEWVETRRKAKLAASQAVKVGLVLASLLAIACTGTLEESRAQLKVSTVGPIALAAEAPRPERCSQLSDREFTWTLVSSTGGILAGGTGLVMLEEYLRAEAQTRGEQPDRTVMAVLVGGEIVSGVAAVVGGLAAKSAKAQWITEGCGQ